VNRRRKTAAEQEASIMSKNVGALDRVVRVLVGLGALSLVVLLEGNLRWAGLIGIVPLATAVLGYCPLYSLFGFKTCPAASGEA
jgi:hypothetical protein